MAYVKIVANKTGTTFRKMDMTGHSTVAVDRAANALESIVVDDRGIVHIEVDYDGCDDSKLR